MEKDALNKRGTPSPPRRSASASASLRADMARVARMSVEERIRAALGMRRRFASLRPSPLGG